MKAISVPIYLVHNYNFVIIIIKNHHICGNELERMVPIKKKKKKKTRE